MWISSLVTLLLICLIMDLIHMVDFTFPMFTIVKSCACPRLLVVKCQFGGILAEMASENSGSSQILLYILSRHLLPDIWEYICSFCQSDNFSEPTSVVLNSLVRLSVYYYGSAFYTFVLCIYLFFLLCVLYFAHLFCVFIIFLLCVLYFTHLFWVFIYHDKK